MNSTSKQSRLKQRQRRVHRLTILSMFVAVAVFTAAAPVSAAVTKAQVKDVSGGLICYCGCASKVVAMCGCATADKIEEDIAAQLESGQTKEEIVAAYLAIHGEKGLATPIASGFNLTAWLMPIFAILIGGFVIQTTVVRWRAQKRSQDQPGSDVSDETDVKHQSRILNELEELD